MLPHLNPRYRLAFIELYHHFEVLRPMLELVNDRRYQVDVFVRSRFKIESGPEILDRDIQWHLFPDLEVRRDWFSRLAGLSEYDLVILLTAPNHLPSFNRVLKGANYVFLVHHINPIFRPINLSLAGASILDYLRIIRYALRYPMVQKLTQLAKGVFFLDDTMLNHLPHGAGKRVRFLPSPRIAHFAPCEARREGSRRDVVIPGSLKGNSRDFRPFLKSLSMLKSDLLQRMRLVFLGAAQGSFSRKILRQISSFELRGLEVLSFPNGVSVKQYDMIYAGAHFIICPFDRTYRIGLHTDVIGETSFSGVASDTIRYGRPTVFSEYHPLNEDLEKHVRRYASSEELAHIMSGMLKQDRIPSKCFSEKFEEEFCRSEFNEWIVDLIDHE